MIRIFNISPSVISLYLPKIEQDNETRFNIVHLPPISSGYSFVESPHTTKQIENLRSKGLLRVEDFNSPRVPSSRKKKV